jgi:hypothetical protein
MSNEQQRARQMDDLVPNLTPRLWRNPSSDTVTVVVGHGEGFRGRAIGKIVIPPGNEAYIERKYDRAIPFLAPQLVPAEPFEEGEGPLARPRTADDLVPVLTHTSRPRKIEPIKSEPTATPAATATPATKPHVELAAPTHTQTRTVKREDD